MGTSENGVLRAEPRHERAHGRNAEGLGGRDLVVSTAAPVASEATAVAAPATATLVRNLRRSTSGLRAIVLSLKRMQIELSKSNTAGGRAPTHVDGNRAC